MDDIWSSNISFYILVPALKDFTKAFAQYLSVVWVQSSSPGTLHVLSLAALISVEIMHKKERQEIVGTIFPLLYIAKKHSAKRALGIVINVNFFSCSSSNISAGMQYKYYSMTNRDGSTQRERMPS